MAAKSAPNRRASASKNSVGHTKTQHNPDDDALEDSLAYEHDFAGGDDDEEEESAGYLARASESVRALTHRREGKVVVAALASGFAIGAAIGCLIAHSHQRKKSWTDRLAYEGLGRRILDRIGSAVPESVAEKFGR